MAKTLRDPLVKVLLEMPHPVLDEATGLDWVIEYLHQVRKFEVDHIAKLLNSTPAFIRARL